MIIGICRNVDTKWFNLKYQKISIRSVNQYNVILGVGVVTIAIVAVIFSADILKLSVSTQEHDIFVDPILDKRSLFVIGRVTIQNTGQQSFTNIRVNFGAGDTLDLGTMKSGQKL